MKRRRDLGVGREGTWFLVWPPSPSPPLPRHAVLRETGRRVHGGGGGGERVEGREGGNIHIHHPLAPFPWTKNPIWNLFWNEQRLRQRRGRERRWGGGVRNRGAGGKNGKGARRRKRGGKGTTIRRLIPLAERVYGVGRGGRGGEGGPCTGCGTGSLTEKRRHQRRGGALGPLLLRKALHRLDVNGG